MSKTLPPRTITAGLTALMLLVLCLPTEVVAANAKENFILVQSTTSTQNSGLFDHLLPAYRALSGVEVRVIAVGTGQALKNAADGNGDVLMVHARDAEEKFIAQGNGVKRYPVMYNEFVIIGPANDPAAVADATSVVEAMRRIAAAGALFVSRGDDSGTHKREQQLWLSAGLDVNAANSRWYKDTGSSMGRTLSIAIELGAYTLSDRATWIAWPRRGTHRVAFEGDPALFNQYSLILVNPARHPHVKAAAGQAFIDWMLSEAGQQAIAAFKVNGEQLFYPNAGTKN